MTSGARIGRARTVLGMACARWLAGAAALALLAPSAWAQQATLHEAAKRGDVAAIEALLAAGADVDAYEYTELLDAEDHEYTDLIELSTPLAVAARHGQAAAIKALLAAGAAPREGTRSDIHVHHWSPLHWAVYGGHAGAVAALLAAPGVAYETEFVLNEKTDVMEEVRLSGGMVDAYSFTGDTPLDYAAGAGDEEIIALLLAAGAAVNTKAPDDDGANPLDAAVLSGHAEAVELLLAAGADVGTTYHGLAPLHRADSVAVVELLLDAGADVNARVADGGERGSTPLHFAVWFGRGVEVVETLLARGADVNARNVEGATPLHWAAGEGEVAAVEVLLAAGADPHARDADGRTPLDHAAAAGHAEAAEALHRASRR